MWDIFMSRKWDIGTFQHVPKVGHLGHLPIGMSQCPTRLQPGADGIRTCPR